MDLKWIRNPQRPFARKFGRWGIGIVEASLESRPMACILWVQKLCTPEQAYDPTPTRCGQRPGLDDSVVSMEFKVVPYADEWIYHDNPNPTNTLHWKYIVEYIMLSDMYASK